MGFFCLVCVGGSVQGGESGNKERVQSGLDLEETLKSWEPSPGRLARTKCKGLPACPPDAILSDIWITCLSKSQHGIIKGPHVIITIYNHCHLQSTSGV